MSKHGHGSRRSGLVAVVVVGLLVVTASSGPVVAHTGDGGHHHDGPTGTHGGMDGWTGGVGVVWMIWTLVVVSIPVALAYLLLGRRGSASETADDALAALRRRYAEGEIDEEEFETRRSRLLDRE